MLAALYNPLGSPLSNIPVAGWYQITTTNGGQFSFNLMDESGRVLLEIVNFSGKAEAEAAIAAWQQNSPFADRYDRQPYYEGRLVFWLMDAAGKGLVQSGIFETEEARDAAIAATIANGPTKDIRYTA